MAKLRKACAYRRLERPYTRKSKYRKKSYVRMSPNIKVVRFAMGNTTGKFNRILRLKAKMDVQVRHNAIEAGRQTCSRFLEKNIGKINYHFTIRIYPHHLLRENPLASGAGADRMSTGMQKAFGKVIGAAARVHEGQDLFCVETNAENINNAKTALIRASKKMPTACRVVIEEIAA